ncbi:MAG: response regulator [Candidatus Rokuibacteriota bacterium]
MMPHVLVIEDEPTLLELLVLAIESHGYEVTGVPRASQALDVVDRLHPELIVLDVVMPPKELDGIQFLFSLRKNPMTADIPVIVVSGLANVINPHTAKHLGVRGLHLKPFETRELLAQIDTLLSNV